jgi:hypothetical protein
VANENPIELNDRATEASTLVIQTVYLLHACVHSKNAQLGPEEGIVMGWITGSYPAFTHRDGMKDYLSNMMGQEVEVLAKKKSPQNRSRGTYV